jgi:hypothetical protein
MAAFLICAIVHKKALNLVRFFINLRETYLSQF